jgi:hypothetical protein
MRDHLDRSRGPFGVTAVDDGGLRWRTICALIREKSTSSTIHRPYNSYEKKKCILLKSQPAGRHPGSRPVEIGKEHGEVPMRA